MSTKCKSCNGAGVIQPKPTKVSKSAASNWKAVAIGIGGLWVGHSFLPMRDHHHEKVGKKAAKVSKQGFVAAWDAAGVNPELLPIAYMESYNGVYVNHEAHSKGRFHTAVGAMGLKPVTGWDTYMKSSKLKAMKPNIDTEEFTELLYTDKDFYNAVCNEHWFELRNLNPTLERAVYSWRWGYGAAQRADEDTVEGDGYVSKYGDLAGNGLYAQTE